MLLYCTLDYCIIMIDGSCEIDWDAVKACHTYDTHCVKQTAAFGYSMGSETDCTEA